MQLAVRSSLTAGIALVGASVIVASPAAPPVPDIHVPAIHASEVRLAALAQVNPFTEWEQVISEALQNTKTIATGVIADPAPILGQVVKNNVASIATLGGSVKDYLTAVVAELGQTPALVKDAIGQFGAGQITDGLLSLYQVVLNPIVQPIINTNILLDIQAVVSKPMQNMVNVINAAVSSPSGLGWLLTAGYPLITLPGDLISATGDGIQNVLAAAKAGNLGAAIGAVLSMPAAITGALLNGYGGDGGGLLGPYGIVQGLRNALHIIAEAIAPAALAPGAAAKVPQARTVVPLATSATAASSGEKAAVAAPKAGKPAPVAAAAGPKPAAATASDDSTGTTTPTANTARRVHGSNKKSAGTDAAATQAGTAATDGGGDTAPTHTTPAKSKGDRSATGKSGSRSHGSAKGD